MPEKSSFQRGLGGGCGLVFGIGLAIMAIPVVIIGGCVALGVGTAVVAPAVHSASDAASRARMATPEDPAPIGEEQPADLAEPVSRTWTDATGKYTVEAEFVELKDGKVRLRKPDGTIKTLPLERLSETDQAWVENQLDLK